MPYWARRPRLVKNKQIVYLDAGHGGKDQGTSYQEVLEGHQPGGGEEGTEAYGLPAIRWG